MEAYLIKSAIIMAVLLGVYYAVFARENLYRFSRQYLLAALVASFTLPLITIPLYVDAVPQPAAFMATPQPATVITDAITPAIVVQTPARVNATTGFTDYLPYIGGAVYGGITLLLTLRFIRNIRKFYTVAKQNEKVKLHGATVVLLDDCLLPYTFMQYIFVSKDKYKDCSIEEELLTHELAHVRQRHTLDVLFTEVLKTAFWFNPLLYFYKKAIQTNHEFLADEAVVQEFNNIPTYQLLLLDKINPPLAYALASSINFNLTKKRFTMMTKTTTKTKGLLLKLAVLPVIAVVTCAFSTKVTVKNSTSAEEQLTVKDSTEYRKERDAYYSDVRVVIHDEANGVFIDKKFEQLTEKQKGEYMFDVPARRTKKQPTAAEFENYKNKKNYAIWIDNKNVDNSILNKYKPEDFASHIGSFVHKNARTKQHPQQYQFTLYTHAYYDKNFTTFHYPDDTYKMNITKVFKDSKVIAGEKPKKFVNVHASEPYDDKGVVSYTELNKVPEYPGGLFELFSFVKQDIKFTTPAAENIKRYYATIIIEKDGTMSYVKVINAQDDTTPQEIADVLKKAAKWQPGEKNGSPVRSSYTIPFDVK